MIKAECTAQPPRTVIHMIQVIKGIIRQEETMPEVIM